MKTLLITLFSISVVIFAQIPALSQEVNWSNSPQKGFVYEISNREAQKLLTGKIPAGITEGLLHTLIDTFVVQKGWTDRPSKGHFILANIIGTKLHCEYTCVFPYQVFLLREYNALALQILDLDGNVRDDAKVKLGYRRLRIDRESKTYRMENDGFNGDNQNVTVELNGFRSVFNIQKHEVPAWYNDDEGEEGPSFYSYLITDKNRYKPNERVRFKSYALSHVKSPLRKELEIWLNAYPKRIKLGNIDPHRPGSYAGEFLLHDSLKLVLDKNYTLQLSEKNGRIVASCSFRYEDYELSGNKLELKLENTRQYFPEKNQMTITATDANDLILKDAKADILVKTNTILESFQPLVILPDTLFFSRIDLDPAKPTVLDIPSEIFQKTNTIYKVEVIILNSQNQRMESSQMATYFYSNYELTTRFSNDSICFGLLKNNIPLDNIPLSMSNDDAKARQILVPYKEKLNPAIGLYHFENKLIKRDVTLSSLNPEVKLTGGIQIDSFNIDLVNPHKLDVSWYIYQGSRLLTKGFGSELEYKSLIEDRTQTFYVEILYSFGGKDQAIRRQFEFKEDYLNVSLDIPERVYPGQKADASITVSDQSGKPVRNVDLTAMAVTGKLDYYIPDLPYYGASSTPRPKGATYSKKDQNKYDIKLDLDYKKWEQLARLDTMLYYRFVYPSSHGFRYSLANSDSTQFSVYVMKQGTAKQIHIIELDRRPVYYSWTNQPKGYSFYVSPKGKHEITLRLSDRVLILDSMTFEKGKKTIISVDLEKLPERTIVYKMENKLTQIEINRHTAYTSEFKIVPNTFAYLESKHEFVPILSRYGLFKNSPNAGRINAGPILPEKKTYIENEFYRTTYQHTGGFGYAFEDNIVYKLTASKLLPEYLYDSYVDPMENINDRAIGKKYFLELQNKDPYPDAKWEATTLDIIDPYSRMRIFMPVEKIASGIAALLFEDCKTKKIVPPTFNKYYHNLSENYRLPEGCNSVILLYGDGSYLKMDSILLKQNIHIAVDLTNAFRHPADNLSVGWLSNYMWKPDNYNEISIVPPRTRTETYYTQNSTGNLVGTIYDETNEPIPGVIVQIKGTNYGTISGLDGSFSLQIDDYTATIIISFVGYKSQELGVTRGSVVSVQLEPEIMALDEVVVVGYGTVTRSELTGSVRGINVGSVSVPREEAEEPEEKQEDSIIHEAEQRLYQELLTLNSIRSNFSDVGFWEPRLYTDSKGKSGFRVTFPDDITRWDAVVYAMNKYLQTGTARKIIRSYKPLVAELNVPQFLTLGDSSLFLGKVLNYTSDSIILGRIQWTGLKNEMKNDIRFTQYHTDWWPVKATTTDSITTRYTFTRDDGYLDGEERTVPVVEQGIERAKGTLSILKNGDDKNVRALENEKVTVKILDNQIDIYSQEVNYLLNYRYDCNEQLASKLIGLINNKLLMQYEGKHFGYDRDVNRIINRLLKNQNKEFLWSWWDVSATTSYWMSAHILCALKCAKDAGYSVDLDIENIARKAEYNYDIRKSFNLNDIDLLNALAGWGVDIKYPKYIPILDSLVTEAEHEDISLNHLNAYSSRYSYLKEKLLLQEIRQMKGLHFQKDSLLKYRKEGMLGDVYFSDGKASRYWYDDDLAATVVAYRIVRNDSMLRQLLMPMQMHFIALRKNNGWNTYQSSNILMNVFPDLLKEGSAKGRIATIQIEGKENKTITSFPYSVELNPDEELHIHKELGLPLYYLQYVNEKVTNAKTGIAGFKIRTYFSNNAMQLEAGKPVDLIVDVDVEKQSSAEHVMIEVPVPGACSYADKRQIKYGIETHREYFKDRTMIFCEKLVPGKYSFVIQLLPRFTGRYFVNPAQVSLMYIPVVNANTDMKQVLVR